MIGIVTLCLNPALDVSVTTPRVQATDKLRCSVPRFDPGGGGINVARMLRVLGAPAPAIFPSGGPHGAMLEQLLALEGTIVNAVPIEGHTRESFTVDEDETGLQFRFVLPGPSLTLDDQQRLLDRLDAISDRPRLLVVSGSLPPGVDREFFVRLKALRASLGARLILDAPGAALRMTAGTGTYLIKPNLKELEAAAGQRLDTPVSELEAARAMVAAGVAQVVVVSLGARGAHLVTRDICEHIAAPNMPTVSAIGAGDSMVAAISFGLLQGWPLLDCVRYGVAAGTAALLTPGTELARVADIERLHRLVLSDGSARPRADPSTPIDVAQT